MMAVQVTEGLPMRDKIPRSNPTAGDHSLSKSQDGILIT
jgi:hypothetical protein